MSNDFKWILICHEWSDIQTCNILYGIFVNDSVPEFLVSIDLIPYLLDFTYEIGMGGCESLPALLVGGIKDCSVGKDDAD